MGEVHITGIDEAVDALQQFPIKADKLVAKCMRIAGKKVAVKIKQGVPKSSWKKLVTSKLYNKINNGDTTSISVGLFSAKKGTDSYFEWKKAYWSNYGTLDYRDSSHAFKTKRRKETAGWRGGIRPLKFYEMVSAGQEEVFNKEFEKAFIEEVNKLYDTK